MPIKVDAIENGTRWRVTNTTGKDLHDVSVKMWLLSGGTWWEYKRDRCKTWESGGELLGQVNYNRGIQQVEFTLRSKEGRGKGVFNADVTPIDSR